GTGTPEVGGLTTRETLCLLRGLDGLNLVGWDLVEVSPPYDPSGNTALLGATLTYEILCLLARKFASSRGNFRRRGLDGLPACRGCACR
ncbi:MAG: arginase family protein, partial [Rhodoferax sp.]|nr:arginase family protein [Rhodoferax sp.]